MTTEEIDDSVDLTLSDDSKCGHSERETSNKSPICYETDQTGSFRFNILRLEDEEVEIDPKRIAQAIAKGNVAGQSNAKVLKIDVKDLVPSLQSQDIAVKVVEKKEEKCDKRRIDYEREIVNLHKFGNSEDLIRLLGVSYYVNRYYIFLEYLEIDLHNFAKISPRHEQTGFMKNELQFSHIFASLDRGLFFLNESLRVVHRDIKGANIMIKGDGKVKIVDFETVLPINSSYCEFGATPRYYPQKLANFSPNPLNVDLMSLAITLYELATGRRFDFQKHADVCPHGSRPQINVTIASIFEKMTIGPGSSPAPTLQSRRLEVSTAFNRVREQQTPSETEGSSRKHVVMISPSPARALPSVIAAAFNRLQEHQSSRETEISSRIRQLKVVEDRSKVFPTNKFSLVMESVGHNIQVTSYGGPYYIPFYSPSYTDCPACIARKNSSYIYTQLMASRSQAMKGKTQSEEWNAQQCHNMAEFLRALNQKANEDGEVSLPDYC